MGLEAGPPIASPLSNVMVNPLHGQEPMFFNLHFFVKDWPGVRMVPSGMVTSATNCATLQLEVGEAAGVLVRIGRVGRGVEVKPPISVEVGTGNPGVALVRAWMVCAAAVRLAPSPSCALGRL